MYRLIITGPFLIMLAFYSTAQPKLNQAYLVGSPIRLNFNPSDAPEYILLRQSYSSFTLTPNKSEKDIVFIIPEYLTLKKGQLKLTGLSKGLTLWTTSTMLIPDTSSTLLVEAFCGPKHLIVGKNDYSMIVASALDRYDNPIEEGREITFKSHIKNRPKAENVAASDLIAYNVIYAPNQSGYGSATVHYKNASSKEFRLDFYANHPSNFKITANRQHEYADGHQLIALTTNKIVDNFENTVENGTIVFFDIVNSQNQLSTVTGETINGVVSIQIPAPVRATIWKIKAYVSGYSSSNTLNLRFESGINRAHVTCSDDEITVGPVQSFMGQIVKDGIPVRFHLSNEDDTLYIDIPTKQGLADLNFRKKFIKPGSYQVAIEVGDYIHSLTFDWNDE